MRHTAFLLTFGLSIIIQNVLLLLLSADSQRLIISSLEVASIKLGSIKLGIIAILAFVSTILVIITLNYIFYNTGLGRTLRAVSDDLTTALLMGINSHLFAIMVIAIVVSAIAAFFLGVKANFDSSIGPARLLYAFESVIIGGLGSLWGTLIGGIIIETAQTLSFVTVFINRAFLQDMFFLLTMLSLSQYWNLLAGYAVLVLGNRHL